MQECRRCFGNIEEDIHTAGRTVSLDKFGADTFTSFFQVIILPTKLQTRWPHCESRSRVTGRVWIFTGLLLTSTPFRCVCCPRIFAKIMHACVML